jgi:hypothetical protein
VQIGKEAMSQLLEKPRLRSRWMDRRLQETQWVWWARAPQRQVACPLLSICTVERKMRWLRSVQAACWALVLACRWSTLAIRSHACSRSRSWATPSKLSALASNLSGLHQARWHRGVWVESPFQQELNRECGQYVSIGKAMMP